MITLLLDENGEERTHLADALVAHYNCTLYSSGTRDEAQSTAESLENIQLLVADVPVEEIDAAMGFRTALRERFPRMVVILVSQHDLSAYYDLIAPDEALFYKPVDHNSLFEWLDTVFPDAVIAKGANAAGPSMRVPLSSPTPPPRPMPTGALRAGASVPRSVPTPAPRPEPTPIPAPAPPADDTYVPGEPLPEGTMLGDYQIISLFRRHGRYDAYIALQTSVDRRVGLNLLRPELADIEEAREDFLAMAKAQASVRHSSIATVFEAKQEGEYRFYTREEIEGRSLADMAQAGETLEEERLLEVIKLCAQAYRYLHGANLHHLEIDPEQIYIRADGSVRLANTVRNLTPEEALSEREQVKNLAKSVFNLTDQATKDNETLPHLMYEMAGTTETGGIQTWDELLKEIKYIETQWKEMGGGITGRKAAIMLGALVGSLILLVSLIMLAVFFLQTAGHSRIRTRDEMARIPAGSFIYQDGRSVELPEYYIDVHEVTIWQYAEFVDFLRGNPDKVKNYDHEDQPTYKRTHEPSGWDAYYKAAREGRKFIFTIQEKNFEVKLDLNDPMVRVDWWDAYAYAKWKGRRLPSEEEWEKAGRGRTGFLYPWGNEPDFSKLNSGIDYQVPGEKKAPAAEVKPEQQADGSGNLIRALQDAKKPKEEGQDSMSMEGSAMMEDAAAKPKDDSMTGGAMSDTSMTGGAMNDTSMTGGAEAPKTPAAADGAAPAPAPATPAPAAPANGEKPAEPKPAVPTPAAPGTIAKPKTPQKDGYVFWAPVDRIEGDASPYVIMGLAGNVSEWTNTWEVHPNDPSKKVPIRRGGSYQDAEIQLLSNRRFSGEASEASLNVGFRTASDTAPAPAPAP